MDESFHQDELSAEDLAILQAFEKMDFSGWEIGESATTGNTLPPNKQPSLPPSASELPVSEDMLTLYIAEAAEDMSIIRRTLQQLEPDEQLDTARLQTIQRTAHKMKGSAGTIGYITISTLAHHIEELTKRILNGTVVPFVGLHVLAQTIQALETTLNSVVTYNQETIIPLNELETEYKTLDIDIYSNSSRPSSPSVHPGRVPFNTAVEDESLSTENPAKFLAGSPTSMPDVRVDMRHFEQLLLHSQQLAELHAPLENAQAEMERAMRELHDAQAHLSHVEASLASHLLLKSSLTDRPAPDERPTSSLVARILDEAAERTGHNYQRKHHFPPPSTLSAPLAGQYLPWDALEIERFTETDVLVHSLNEAIADVATASTQLRLAFARLQRITHKHVTQASCMRNDVALLRLTSMSVLLNRIERAVTMNGIAWQRQIQFEVTGETTEIDQDRDRLLTTHRWRFAQRSAGSHPSFKRFHHGSEKRHWQYQLLLASAAFTGSRPWSARACRTPTSHRTFLTGVAHRQRTTISRVVASDPQYPARLSQTSSLPGSRAPCTDPANQPLLLSTTGCAG